MAANHRVYFWLYSLPRKPELCKFESINIVIEEFNFYMGERKKYDINLGTEAI